MLKVSSSLTHPPQNDRSLNFLRNWTDNHILMVNFAKLRKYQTFVLIEKTFTKKPPRFIFLVLSLLPISNLFSVKNASFQWNKGFRANSNYIKEIKLGKETPEVFYEKRVLRKTPVLESLFLIKLQASALQLYYKRDSATGVFLWILCNFKEHLFYRTTPNNCFWN